MTTECFTQNGIVRLLQALGFLVETRQVPFENMLHTNQRIIFQCSSVWRKKWEKLAFFFENLEGNLLGNNITMIVIISQLFEETSRFQYEGGQDHLAQVHAGTHLLQQGPQQ